MKMLREFRAYAESGQMDGMLAAHSVTTLFYLLRRHLDVSQARAALHGVLHVFRVAPQRFYSLR